MRKKRWFLAVMAMILVVLVTSWWWHHRQTKIQVREVSFADLPGWSDANLKQSLQAFKISCHTFLRQPKDNSAGSSLIPIQVQDWHLACKEAFKINNPTQAQARNFFEHFFTPLEFRLKGLVPGLFTGYYQPLLQGSLKKTEKYHVPIYGRPKDLLSLSLRSFDTSLPQRTLWGRVHNQSFVPYYSREQINKGAVLNKAPVIAWVTNYIDRLYLGIQGSGVIELPNKKLISVGYDSQNGLPYTPVGSVLVKKGVLSKENASMQSIRAYLQEHPKEIRPILNKNQSFVFFRVLPNDKALGAQGVPLTPKYSLAVDHKYIPYGTPVWLHTTHPDAKTQDTHVLQKLMIAQDTGGAIRGLVRGDVYWGPGEKAAAIAGKMKHSGYYWLLLPKPVAKELLKKPLLVENQ